MIIMTDYFTKKKFRTRVSKRSLADVLLPLRFAIVLFVLMGSTSRLSAQTYCSPSGAGSTWSILSVSTTGGTTNISNLASGYSTNGYGDFTTMTVSVAAGNSFTMTAVAGALASFTYKWAVWIDYNSDGDFDDLGETAYSYLLSTGINTMVASITVPSGATAGNRRMRVRNLRDYNTDLLVPCGSLPGNETEDYTLVVSSSVPVTCPAPTAPVAGTLTPTSAVLNWTQTGTPPQWQIKYGAPGFNPVTGGTSIFTPSKPYTLSPPLAASTAYEYYVRAVCGPSDTSLWSAVTAFTTTCNAPSVVSKKDSFGCGAGATVVLEATTTAGSSIKWYAALTGGTALATGNSFTTPALPANTTYYIAAANGTCESSPRMPVVASIRPVPVVNLGNDTTICPGVAYVLNATTPNATYAWNIGATTSSITVNAAGSYSVLVTLNGCGGSDAKIITPGLVPVNNLPATLNLCAGDVVNLNAGNTGSTFLWTPGGANTQTINVTAGGNYAVNITSINGCTINSTTNIIERPLPVAALGNDTSICEGDQITLNAGNTGYAYLWNTSASTQTIAVADSGTYTVTVTSPYNCNITDDVHVAFLPAPRVEGFNFIPLFYEELGKVKFFPLNPTNTSSYKWDFGDGSPTTIQMNPLHVYATDGNYNVTLTVYNGCGEYTISLVINVDRVTGMVTLTKDRADVTIYPNPSNNQISIVQKNDAVKMETVMVFNTLGALVYESKVTNSKHHQLSVAGLAAGVYSVRIVTDKGYINRKIVVSK